jgi:pyruvate,orthophosphate dikinase
MLELINFNQNEFLEGDDLQERFGLRGRNMLQLAQLKTPIAPGFLIESSSFTDPKFNEELTIPKLEASVKKIEALTGKTFDAPKVPMLFKAVISPSIQIGTIRSVHAIGINDAMAEGFAKFCGEDFAYQEYRHFIATLSTRFLGMKAADFDAVDKANAKASHKDVCGIYRKQLVPEFPQNGYEQLRLVLGSMAKQYLEDGMNEGIEAGVLVQMMVYGNFGEKSYNGNFYSRDIVTGEPRLTGYFGHNEFDTPKGSAQDINTIKKEYLTQLGAVASKLEEKFLDIREIKFVIEEDRVWVVEQNPVDAKSTQAEIRTLLDLNRKGLVPTGKLVSSIPPGQIQDLLHPVIDHATTRTMAKIVGGLAGSPGAAVGRVAFSTPALLSEFRRCSLMGVNSDLILVMPHTDAEDVESIELGKGVIASVGGYASHAPVVSRSLRKPCLMYEDIQFHEGYIIMGGIRVNEFDTVSMEVPTYTDPTVWHGEAKLVYPDTSTNGLEDFIAALGAVASDFKVYGSAESLNDVTMALRMGAEGIGMFPCDALLKQPGTIGHFREALLVGDGPARKAALKKVEQAMRGDVVELLKTLGGKKIIFRLLENPLTEFLPHAPDEMEAMLKDIVKRYKPLRKDDLMARANQLRNVNPMLGLRGSRIAISYPDLYEAQVEAILMAACEHAKAGGAVDLDLMVPAVMSDSEMRFIRHGRNIESTTIRGIGGVQRDVLAAMGLEELPFTCRIGCVIELPAAALMAGHMAKQSDFFGIDTEMLTQTTNGMSKDDVNLFLPSYTQYDILKDDPFQILSTPVKELIAATVHFGKITRPDLQIGLLGEHGSDPVNISFALNASLGFVTCSPYGIPIAKLAVAQHALKQGANN